MSILRGLATPLAVIAVISLIYLVNPWLAPPAGTVTQVVTIVFWASSVLLAIALFEDRKDPESQRVEIEGPAWVRYLFNNSRAGLFWLPIRVFVGFSWLAAGLHKLGDPAWQNGTALGGFWKSIVAVPQGGRAPITYDWYRDFINWLLANNAQTWFTYFIEWGEIAVGLGLIFGVLTGFAAFFGCVMNMSFLLAGSASTNPILFTLAIGLMLAWRVAGYYGVDRYLLPRLGTPWSPGAAAVRRPQMSPARG
jgi:thiosulfate dehydrogenase [quinone] large subunit